ncbi:MAG TPA: thiamine-phosphate kinase [Candidatus Omnitrophica bacterium]|nr:MAG: thiamine-phosphate kinase [Omnitrophica WOR_2 bacterium GWA2_45_18]HBR14909.1 thiamine-phosphate kinase [Candidatus Omnitrophota bacterium]
MSKKLSQLGEFGVIDRIRKIAGHSRSVMEGIGDDAAVVSSSEGKDLLLTTDMLLEGVHFTKDMPARGIGHKAMACSISDIAAMGGIPKYAVVSLGVSRRCEWDFVKQIYEGMKKTARKFDVAIVGGDTVRSPGVIINVALVGEVARKKAVLRRGAKVGDLIFVSGPLGGSLKSGRHLRFVPRVAEAQYLVKHFNPTAMIDISDGLAADLGHILEESRVGAVIYENKIPRHPDADSRGALYYGEDFELIVTVSPRKAEGLRDSRKSKFKFWPIGEITARRGCLQFVDEKGRIKTLSLKGYTHF